MKFPEIVNEFISIYDPSCKASSIPRDDKLKLYKILVKLVQFQTSEIHLDESAVLRLIKDELKFILKPSPTQVDASDRPIIKENALPLIQQLSMLCILAAQFSAMRGEIHCSLAFDCDVYYKLYTKEFGEYELWRIEACERSLAYLNNEFKGGPLLILHCGVALGESLPESLHPSFLTCPNAYGETVVQLQERLFKKPSKSDLLMSQVNDIAGKMAKIITCQMIGTASDDVKKCLDYLPHSENKLIRNLTLLIANYIRNRFISISETSAEDIESYKPNQIPARDNSEILMILNYYGFILTKLSDKSVRDKFFASDSHFIDPLIICSFCFQLVPIQNDHGSDDIFDLVSHEMVLESLVLPQAITLEELKKWEIKFLILVDVINSTHSFDDSEGKPLHIPKPLDAEIELRDCAALWQNDRLLFLLEQNVKQDNKDEQTGDTALHLAVKRGNFKGVDILLGYPGVDLNLRNAQGDTPYDLALKSKNELWKKQEDLLEELKPGQTSYVSRMLSFLPSLLSIKRETNQAGACSISPSSAKPFPL